jgi:ankyrin repeat protein
MSHTSIKKYVILAAAMLALPLLPGCIKKTVTLRATPFTSTPTSTPSSPAKRSDSDALNYALQTHDVAKVKALLKKNPVLANTAGPVGDTVLMKAAFWGHADVVELLIAKGARVNTANHFDETALDKAKFFKRDEVIKVLLRHGAKPGKKK